MAMVQPLMRSVDGCGRRWCSSFSSMPVSAAVVRSVTDAATAVLPGDVVALLLTAQQVKETAEGVVDCAERLTQVSRHLDELTAAVQCYCASSEADGGVERQVATLVTNLRRINADLAVCAQKRKPIKNRIVDAGVSAAITALEQELTATVRLFKVRRVSKKRKPLTSPPQCTGNLATSKLVVADAQTDRHASVHKQLEAQADEIANTPRRQCLRRPTTEEPTLATSRYIPAAKLPPLPQIFGREREVEAVVRAIDSSPAARVAILGGPGIGKTSVALAAIRERSVAVALGTRRFYVPCDGAGLPLAFLPALAAALGVVASGRKKMLAQVLEMLGAHPSVLILDNFETTWEPRDNRSHAEEVLALVAAIPTLHIIVTMRGAERPAGIAWSRPFLQPLSPLTEQAALQVFAAISDVPDDDTDLAQLMQHLGNLPLAIVLMATMAQYRSCKDLLQEWNVASSSMLRRGDEQRLSCLDTSITLSITSPRMQRNAGALQALSILSLLPDGIDRSELLSMKLAIAQLERCISTLISTGLAYRSANGLLSVLAPVREFVLRNHPSDIQLLQPLYEHYISIVQHMGKRVGHRGGAEAELPVSKQMGNVQCVLNKALDCPAVLRDAIDAKIQIAKYVKIEGRGAPESLHHELALAKQMGDLNLIARCFQSSTLHSGQLLSPTREALVLFERAENLSAQCHCLCLLAAHGDSPRERVDRALIIAEQITEDSNAQARALLLIGYALCQMQQFDEATTHLLRTAHIYRTTDDPHITSFILTLTLLSDLHRGGGRLALALECVDEAMRMVDMTDDLNAAKQFQSRGSVEMALGHLEAAVMSLTKCYELFQRLQCVDEQAEGLRLLVRAHLALGNIDEAESCLNALKYVAEAEKTRFINPVRPGDLFVALSEGEIALHCRHYEVAVAAYRVARELCTGNLSGWQWQCLVPLAKAYAAEGMHDEAEQHAVLAVVLSYAPRAGKELSFAVSALADVCLSKGSMDDADALTMAVLPQLRKMGTKREVADSLLRLAKLRRDPNVLRAGLHLYKICGDVRGIEQANELLVNAGFDDFADK